MPGLYELLDGSVHISQVREISIEDLLRREPIQTDVAAVTELLAGKRVLVTGGGGSIGGELCRQILRSRPAELLLLGHGENSIFEMHNELMLENQRLFGSSVQLTPLIAAILMPLSSVTVVGFVTLSITLAARRLWSAIGS